MARSLSNAKILSVFVSEKLSNAVFRRGFAVAAKTVSEGSVSSGETASSAVMKNKVVEASSEKAPWVPDPKTGYYRPETVSEEIDPAELRAVLLNNKQ
ncbi:PREDICTED: protein SENESCENCE-ASSOCIATED GENE 21, mitochondrial-like [Camelina sativa]|uniref:Protein SENESCENCE-ASSOCIATED GENE 21, mitochondrial-like n=1 Tax=Camelina sativa TaxID=90675 RepID=A0ABM0WQU5_CAMSA|nr:PREDICTED: protein SENESCENCE-ASSOCIATED GENE 21, mitochondrial-like [Camelina sativa]